MQDPKNTFVDGEVTQALPNTMFRVTASDGRELMVSLKGSLRRSWVRIFPGDKVRIEMTPYDELRGRIVQKYQK